MANRATQPEPAQAAPDVERGDEVYFRHKTGPLAGKVLSRGAHGVIVEHKGKRHPVRWGDLHGHKVKVRPEVKVVDQGEDGMIVEDRSGGRRFVHDPLEPPREQMVKSCRPVVLLFGEPELLVKAGMKGRPGLHLESITDKAGHQTKRWKAGDKVAFTHPTGGHPTHGEVVGEPGKDGAHVKEHGTGAVHPVLHKDLQAHEDGPKQPSEEEGAAPTAASKPFYSPEETEKLPAKAVQPHKTWEDLSRHGKVGLAQFKGALSEVVEKMGLRADLKPDKLEGDHLSSKDGFLFVAPLKGEARANEKVEAEYGGDWSKLRDMVRGTIAVSSMDELHQAVDAVKAAGLKLAMKPNDRFAKPTASGYRDLMVNVKLPNGMLAELQFHLKAMTAAKNEGHKHYETERGLQAKYRSETPDESWSDEDHTAFYKARKAQKDIYGKAWASAGGVDQSEKSD